MPTTLSRSTSTYSPTFPTIREGGAAELQEEFGADAEVSFVRMDLASLDNVRNAAEEVLETVPRIDASSATQPSRKYPHRN